MDLNTKKITDSRTAWKTDVPLFTKTHQKMKRLPLMKNKIIFLMTKIYA